MKLMSVDQSLSHCAVVVWEDGVPAFREMIRTGSTSSKVKHKDVVYFDTVTEQIQYIVNRIILIAEVWRINAYVMESLSLGSIGNATRDLAGLYHSILYALLQFDVLGPTNLFNVAPTTVKAFARNFLPEEEQRVTNKKVDKKTGKDVYSNDKVKMEKAQIVRACGFAYPGWLDGMTLAAGKADFADAYFIGRVQLQRLEAKSQ